MKLISFSADDGCFSLADFSQNSNFLAPQDVGPVLSNLQTLTNCWSSASEFYGRNDGSGISAIISELRSRRNQGNYVFIETIIVKN